MWRCPGEIEQALWAAARARLRSGALREDVLERAVVARSRLYTSDREPLEPGNDCDERSASEGEARAPDAEQDLAARALFFTVADAAKIQVPLAELGQRGLLPQAAPLRVVDVGAGAGAMSLGAIGYLRPRELEIRAFDRDRGALEILRAALGELPPAWRSPVELQVVATDVRDLVLEPHSADLVIAGTVFNELSAGDRRALVRRLLGAVSDRGALIIIEPALRETSRALHELRDYVLAESLASVFAPCVRTGVPCPALAVESDWCHEDRPTELPERAARLARRTGLRRHGLKFAYLVLRRDPDRQVDAPGSGRRALRVVSRPRKLKGKRECFACGEQGRIALRLLRRNRSSSNRPFERARRGDVLILGEQNDLGKPESVDLRRVESVEP